MPISFVLVEPARATNVGAAARAIKTMGFGQLVLVNSRLHLESEAQWLAHGATDVLDNTRVIDSLAQLRREYDLLIGTTARERGSPRQYLNPAELNQRLSDTQLSSCALLFGRESSGLSNEELNLCDLYSYVPLANDYPSLNLAQAVMVYSYALSNLSASIGLNPVPAAPGQLQALKQKARDLLTTLEVQQDEKLSQWLQDGLARLAERDCKMAHQLLNDVLRKLEK
jgi:tRNA/rRNA methyltransferase